MSAAPADIAWETVRRIAKRWAGTAAEPASVTPCSGGADNTVVRVELADGARCVLKITPFRSTRKHEHEAEQLAHLRTLGVPTPEVYATNVGSLAEPDSYVLMAWVDAVPLSRLEACAAERLHEPLAEMVAAVHACKGECWGRWGEDAPHADWPAFFGACFGPIVEEVSGALPAKTCRAVEKIAGRLRELLHPGDGPRLLHWDLWGGNVLCRQGADGWELAALIDPACVWGCPEAELATLELFGLADRRFRRAYAKRVPVDAEWARVRRPTYQLFALLNQIALHGPTRAAWAVQGAERLAAELA